MIGTEKDGGISHGRVTLIPTNGGLWPECSFATALVNKKKAF